MTSIEHTRKNVCNRGQVLNIDEFSEVMRRAAPLSRRAGAFAMGQRRAYQGNLQDKDRIFTNL